jgi:hypothetical protein
MGARLRSASVLVGSMVVFGLLSVRAGQDASWDLRNYHYYNPYAFLNGRFGWDLAPAQLPTYLNPLLDVPFYLLVEHVPPTVYGFTVGAWQGTTLWLLFLLAARLYSGPPQHATAFALVAAGVGVYGAGATSELGTTFHDLTLAPLVALALLLVLGSPAATGWARAATMGGAGVALGCAVGLKYTVAMFVPGMAVAIAWLWRERWRRALPALAWWAGGVALGVAVTAGYWMIALHARYGNPLGPFFNGLFKSPYFELSNFHDPRFFPRNWTERLFYPFYFRLPRRNVMEVPFQDLRFAVLYALLIAAVAVLAWSTIRRSRGGRTLPGPGRPSATQEAFLAFVVISYVVWQVQFSIYRYLVPLEVLVPLAIYVVASVVWARPASAVVATLVCFVVIVGTVRAPDLGRVAWGKTFFGTAAPPVPSPASALGVLVSDHPLAFVVPAFPKEMRFVRLLHQETPGSRLRRAEVTAAIREHRGAIYILAHRGDVSGSGAVLARYGLLRETETCVDVTNRLDPDIVLCRAARLPTTGAGSGPPSGRLSRLTVPRPADSVRGNRGARMAPNATKPERTATPEVIADG